MQSLIFCTKPRNKMLKTHDEKLETSFKIWRQIQHLKIEIQTSKTW